MEKNVKSKSSSSFRSGNDFPVEPSLQSANEDFSLHAARAQSHPCGAGPGLANIKEIQRLCGGDLQVASQANVQIDAEIGQKDHFPMETSSLQGGKIRSSRSVS